MFQYLQTVDVFQEGNADLPAMSPGRNLCLSKFVAKSVVEVNEEGTEAAAESSAEGIIPLCLGGGPSWFCADHPFLFFIHHVKTNGILFCGRFSSP